MVLRGPAAVGSRGKAAGLLERHGRGRRIAGRGRSGWRRSHGRGVASVHGLLGLCLAVAALEAQAQRDFSLELDARAFEQRQERAGVDAPLRVRRGRGREVARRAAQLGPQRGIEPRRTCRCGRRARIGLGAERFEPLAGIGERPPHVIDRGALLRGALQQADRLALKTEEPGAVGIRWRLRHGRADGTQSQARGEREQTGSRACPERARSQVSRRAGATTRQLDHRRHIGSILDQDRREPNRFPAGPGMTLTSALVGSCAVRSHRDCSRTRAHRCVSRVSGGLNCKS